MKFKINIENDCKDNSFFVKIDAFNNCGAVKSVSKFYNTNPSYSELIKHIEITINEFLKPDSWNDFFGNSLTPSNDFEIERDKSAPQTRECFGE